MPKDEYTKYRDLTVRGAFSILESQDAEEWTAMKRGLGRFLKKRYEKNDKHSDEIDELFSEIVLRHGDSRVSESANFFDAMLSLAKEMREEANRSCLDKERLGKRSLSQNKELRKQAFTEMSLPVPRSNAEQRKEHQVASHFYEMIQALDKMHDNIREEFGNRFDKEFEQVKQSIGKDWFLPLAQEVIKNGTPIYQIADDDKDKCKKLLYTLRKIEFPLSKLGSGRKHHFIPPPHIQLFERIYPAIELIWKAEENHKAWIAFMRHRDWEKSRVSHFMSRRIKDGSVPDWFFDYWPPSDDTLDLLIKKGKVFSVAKVIKPYSKLKSRKELTASIKLIIAEGTKTLLSA